MGSIPHGRDHGGGDHPVPFRTRQLSPPSPRVLRWSPWEGRESRPWGMLRVLRGFLRGGRPPCVGARGPFSFGAFGCFMQLLLCMDSAPFGALFVFGDLVSCDLKRDLARNCLDFATPCPRGSDLPSPASVIQSYQQYPPLIRNFWLLSTTFGCESGAVEGNSRSAPNSSLYGFGALDRSMCWDAQRVRGGLYSSTPSSSFTRLNAAAMALSMS